MEAIGRHAPLERQLRYKIAKSLLDGIPPQQVAEEMDMHLDYVYTVKKKILNSFVVFEDKNLQRSPARVEAELFEAIEKEQQAKTDREKAQWKKIVDNLQYEYVFSC